MLSHDTIAAARSAILRKDVSASDLARQAIARIEALNPEINAFNSHDAARALQVANDVDEGRIDGPLAGVPIALKDNLCTTWGTTTCSSKMLENFHAPYDATVVKKLEAAGAVLLGKCNLDEFAMGSSTENSAFGVTRNPWDATTVPGGSSGGSAAAVAASMACGALGSDTGGSIRQPAALCGLVGLKPTYGTVSRYGLVAFASSLDQIGPLTWTVEDAALLMNAITGHDDLDSTSVPAGPDHYADDYTKDLDVPVKGLKLGVVREFVEHEGIDPDVKKSVEAAIAIYEEHGAEIVDVKLPHAEYGIAAYYIIAPSEASSNLARYDGVHFGHRTAEPVEDIVELFSKSRAEGFGPEVQRRIMIGTYALSSGYYDAYYNRALKLRAKIRGGFDDAFKQCDLILTPTAPTPAFKIGEKANDPLAMYLCDIFTVVSNIAGNASLSLPCGFSTDPEKPLPIGLQLVGPNFSEAKLLRVARMLESVTDYHKRRPVVA
ncbi:MAG: Asp-tRNA(Asn)/Glu-tRNA(Gln) amidotransferase subunit GatA [Planctomycetota bacterium]